MQQDTQEQQERIERAARLEVLVQEISSFTDPHARATSEELLQLVLATYGEGLARMLEITMQTEGAASPLLKAFADDEVVGSLLLLHDLHPLNIEARVAQALDEVRPYLRRHNGGVELLDIRNGVVFLRLDGSCRGCSSSTDILKQTIEEAIYKAAPDVVDIVTEGAQEVPTQPLIAIPTRRTKSRPGSAVAR